MNRHSEGKLLHLKVPGSQGIVLTDLQCGSLELDPVHVLRGLQLCNGSVVSRPLN